MEENETFLDSCLFFNTNALSRYLLKLAQNQFNHLNMSPAHASLMLLVYDNPGVNPKQLGIYLHLTPSTITRFIDALEKKEILIRKTRGKSTFIYPSDEGIKLKKPIALAYKNLYLEYTRILGRDTAMELSMKIHNAAVKLKYFFDENG